MRIVNGIQKCEEPIQRDIYCSRSTKTLEHRYCFQHQAAHDAMDRLEAREAEEAAAKPRHKLGARTAKLPLVISAIKPAPIPQLMDVEYRAYCKPPEGCGASFPQNSLEWWHHNRWDCPRLKQPYSNTFNDNALLVGGLMDEPVQCPTCDEAYLLPLALALHIQEQHGKG